MLFTNENFIPVLIAFIIGVFTGFYLKVFYNESTRKSEIDSQKSINIGKSPKKVKVEKQNHSKKSKGNVNQKAWKRLKKSSFESEDKSQSSKRKNTVSQEESTQIYATNEHSTTRNKKKDSINDEELMLNIMKIQQEMESLSNIYQGDYSLLKSHSKTVCGLFEIILRPSKSLANDYKIKLSVEYCENYPKNNPNVKVSFDTKTLSLEEDNLINSTLKSSLKKYSDFKEVYIYDICISLEDALNSMNEKYHKYKENIQNCLYDQHESSIIESSIIKEKENDFEKLENEEIIHHESGTSFEENEFERKISANAIENFKKRVLKSSMTSQNDFFLLESSSFVKKESLDSVEENNKNSSKLKSRYLNDFQEVEMIGEGGSAQVFKVKNKLEGNFYAIKKIELDISNTKNFAKILKEVTLFSRLHHHHIVRYFQAWVEDNPDECDDDSDNEEDSDEGLNSDEESSIDINEIELSRNEFSVDISFDRKFHIS